MITFGAFLQPKALCEAAKLEARLVTERWDVPRTVEVDGKVMPVAPDINDCTPRYQGTRDGRRIAGRFLLEDGRTGGPSPAVSLLIATLAPLVIVSQIFAAFGFSSGVALASVAMLAALCLVWRATSSFMFTLLCGLLLALANAGNSGLSPSSLGGVMSGGMSAMSFLIGAGILVAFYLILRPSASVIRAMLWGAGALAVIAFLAFHAPAWLRPVVLLTPLGILPYAYVWTQHSQWAALCYEQELVCLGEE